ncbi:MAG: methyl-accepting chemotaxis protein [Labrys sp. (in: a-proteobacteria)]|jgi:methyl-accepting chemotaxis protein
MQSLSTIAGRIALALSALFLTALIAGTAGWMTSGIAFKALNTIYADRVVPLKDLKLISDKYAVDIVDATHKMRSGAFDWEAGGKAVKDAKAVIDERWTAYLATYLTEEEKGIANTVGEHTKVSDQAVAKLLSIIAAKDQAALDAFVTTELYPAIDPTTEAIGKLVDLQVRVAGEVFAETEATFTVANMVVVASLVAALVAFVAAFWFTRGKVVRPLREITSGMKDIAGGNTALDVPHLGRTDEIGAMAQALEVFRVNASERARLEHSAQQERDRERQRQSHVETLIADFRALMARTLTSVNSETGSMLTTAEKLNMVASSAANDAESAGLASSGASNNVQTVAAAAEELAASIREIAGQADQATSIVKNATDTAVQTDKSVSTLADAAEKVGAIVELIRDIAEQTNLLALNATIEAARAGDMGKGFAVVAAEVKTLANQTAKATDEIATQIGGIQTSTRSAVESIRAITRTVGDISSVTTAIAAAVEEQEAATREISKAIQSASDGTTQVAHNVSMVGNAIVETSREARSVHNASETLTNVARELANSVEQFLSDVTKDLEDRRGALRRRMIETVFVTVGGRRLSTTLINLSETGCLLAAVDGIRMGDPVVIELADGRTAPAAVLRLDRSEIAVQFRERLVGAGLPQAA